MASLKKMLGRHWRRDLGVARTPDRGRRVFKGICSSRERRLLTSVSASVKRRYLDPNDAFQAPYYRHPQSRRWAREARRAEAAKGIDVSTV